MWLWPACRSVCAWLALRAGASVQRLQLDAEFYTAGPAVPHDSGRLAEYAAHLAAGLAACRALTDLDLTAELSNCSLGTCQWLAPLARRLRRLVLEHNGPITVPPLLAALTALQELQLGVWCDGLILGKGVRLPASLTSLGLGQVETEPAMALPTQVSSQSITLLCCAVQPGAQAVAQLVRLQGLPHCRSKRSARVLDRHLRS